MNTIGVDSKGSGHIKTCPICIANIDDDQYITDCNHSFCKDCMIALYQYYNSNEIKCPLCRNTLYIYKDEIKRKKILFDITNYPENPSIPEELVLEAYKTVTRQNAWKLLYDYVVDRDTGFMFAKDPNIKKLMNQINEDYNDNHSGFSMGYTMQQLYFIANFGLIRYLKIKKYS